MVKILVKNPKGRTIKITIEDANSNIFSNKVERIFVLEEIKEEKKDDSSIYSGMYISSLNTEDSDLSKIMDIIEGAFEKHNGEMVVDKI